MESFNGQFASLSFATSESETAYTTSNSHKPGTQVERRHKNSAVSIISSVNIQ